jgi:tetratricopeptide (TPR) repeat protein
MEHKTSAVLIMLLLFSCFISFGQTGEDANKLYSEGQNLFKQYRFEEAIEKFVAAAEIIKNNCPDRKADLGYAYYWIGECYRLLGQHEKALEYFRDALALAEELGRKSDIATYLNNIAIVYGDRGQYTKALEYYEQALALAEELGKKDQIAILSNNIGMIYYDLAQYDMALEHLNKSLVIMQEFGQKDNIAVILSNIGLIYDARGRYDKALEYYRQALALAKELGLKDSIVIDLNNIAHVYNARGQYDKALDCYKQALALADELALKGAAAISLNGIGTVYLSWGQNDKALDCYTKALEINKKLDKKDQIAINLSNIGYVFMQKKQYDKSVDYYKQALAISQELGARDQVAIQLNNIGFVYDNLGQLEKALDYYKKALAINEELGIKDGIAIDLNNIGGVYAACGMNDKALEYFQKALAVDEELGIKDGIATDLNNIGVIYHDKKEYKMASKYFNDSISIIEALRLTAPGSARREYLALQIVTYQWLISTYIRDSKPELAFHTMELSSAKYLSEQMGQRTGAQNFSFKGITSYQNKMKNKAVIINFANTDWNDSAIVVVSKHNISAIEVNKKSFISGINKRYKGVITKTVEGLRGLKVVAKQSDLEQAQKTEKGEFDNIINYYRYLLSKQYLSRQEIKTLDQIAKELYKLFIAPLEKQLEGKEELIIIPDGILCFLPFETLIMPDGRYLIEKYHIKYTQSLTVSELIAQRSYSTQRKPLLAFGGAVYEQSSYESDMIESEQYLAYLETQTLAALDKGESTRSMYNELGLSGWGNLPGTLTEIIAIGRIIPRSVVYKGADVTEYKIKQLSKNGFLDDYKVLHFATHGLVVPEIPELSAIVLSLFKNEKNNEDGYLNMKEIAMLEIKADFVNLSACETGLGKIYGGEGVVGLTQSFLIAGANGLSVSLWQVADESTMQFMIGMYSLVQEQGYSYDRAITEMKRRFISGKNHDGKDYSKPFFWAPFVYYGE